MDFLFQFLGAIGREIKQANLLFIYFDPFLYLPGFVGGQIIYDQENSSLVCFLELFNESDKYLIVYSIDAEHKK